jgi:hypothetical protein
VIESVSETLTLRPDSAACPFDGWIGGWLTQFPTHAADPQLLTLYIQACDLHPFGQASSDDPLARCIWS